MTGVVHRLGKRDAHEAGRGQCAIKAGDLHHLQDVANALAFLTEPDGKRFLELDLRGGIRAIAELIFEPLQSQRVDRAIRTEPGQEKTGLSW